MPKRNLRSFSSLISACRWFGDVKMAVGVVDWMRKSRMAPNQFVFSSLVAACSKMNLVKLGKQVHAQVVVSNFGSDPYVKASLIDMYSKSKHLASAVSVFKHGILVDPVVFNSMLNGFAVNSCFREVLEWFGEMRRSFGFNPTEFSFGSLIKAVGCLRKEVGGSLHGLITKIGLDTDCFIASSLVDMYGKFEDTENMEMVFHRVQLADIALYNSVLVGLSRSHLHIDAWEYFRQLLLEGSKPNECTFSSILKACGGMKSKSLGSIVHGFVEQTGYKEDLVVRTALIDMYMKCGMIEEAIMIFDWMHQRNTISYNSMIFGYIQNGYVDEAMHLFIDMNRQRLEPDLATFVALMGLSMGYQWAIYVHAVKRGYAFHPMAENALLDGLFKSGDCEEGIEFLKKMNERNVISWTTAVAGLMQLDFHSKSIELFKEMRYNGVSPNNFTFCSVLKTCGSLANLQQGKCIHGYCLKIGEMDDRFVSGSLLDMYARCGALEDSCRFFDDFLRRDTVSWNKMISAYAQHGFGLEALELYTKMVEHDVEPNTVTFLSLLSACSHHGLVDDGVRIFDLMVSKHNVVPLTEHYACMVDMFGRAGMLSRAKSFIESMPIKADASIWTVFLSACKLHGNLELAQLAIDCITQMEWEDNAPMVLVSNMYSEAGKWVEAENMRERMQLAGQIKHPGISCMQTMWNPLLEA